MFLNVARATACRSIKRRRRRLLNTGSGLHQWAMADIVNLRRARKQKARAATETEAAANRLLHGRSKADRKLSKAEKETADRKLDGHKRGNDND